MKNFVLFFSILFTISQGIAQTLPPSSEIDVNVLNQHILTEVNKYRKKARVHLITNNTALLDAAQDHSDYLSERKKLSHKQQFNKVKRWPKNRVDYFGQQFDIVGENVQRNSMNLQFPVGDKKHPRVTSYEQLAEKLVLSWKKSPPHYKNMISENYHHTYTAVTIREDGTVFGCQLFSGTEYKDKHEAQHDTINYKPDNSPRCWRCRRFPPSMGTIISPDSIIYAITPKKKYSKLRWVNPWTTGLAADIVLKSQYPCDTLPYYNGMTAVRGIPLEPVYKKDFRKGSGSWRRYFVAIPLGKVPSYIDEDFEVNLTFIYNNRPCGLSISNILYSSYSVNIPLEHDIPDLIPENMTVSDSTVTALIFFEKGATEIDSTSLNQALSLLTPHDKGNHQLELIGYASIEGSTKDNITLYQKRAKNTVSLLHKAGIDTSITSISAKENFADFRKDIATSEYASWAALSDSALKVKVNENAEALEHLLKEHRFVKIQLHFQDTLYEKVDGTGLVQELQRQISLGEYKEAQSWLKACYSAAKRNEIDLDILKEIRVPLSKKSFNLAYEKVMFEYTLQKKDPRALDTLKIQLTRLLKVKKKKNDKRANTSLAIVDYKIFERNFPKSSKTTRKWFTKMGKRKYLDRKILARIQLNVASKHDWNLSANPFGIGKGRKYLFKKTRKYIRNARLEVDDLFDLATYFTYFGEYKQALKLTRNKIDETINPDHHVFFLKLIHLYDPKISRSLYLKYFKRVRKYSGEQFCTYFNTPNLNFQILDDPEIREIYCEECATENN